MMFPFLIDEGLTYFNSKSYQNLSQDDERDMKKQSIACHITLYQIPDKWYVCTFLTKEGSTSSDRKTYQTFDQDEERDWQSCRRHLNGVKLVC